MSAKDITVIDDTPKPDKSIPVVVGGRGLQLRTLDDMWRFAQMVTKGGFAPKGMEKPEAVLIAVQMGLEVGLSPMQAIQSIAVINNRPAIWGDAAKALVDASGLCTACREWIDGTGDNQTAFCEVRRVGRPDPVHGKFSVADAKRASLWGKGNTWGFYPERMLQMRARAFCLRDAFPDVLKGLSIREEAQDIPPIDVTPHTLTMAHLKAPESTTAKENEDPLAAEREGVRTAITMAGITEAAAISACGFMGDLNDMNRDQLAAIFDKLQEGPQGE